jgi:hypothetical protein
MKVNWHLLFARMAEIAIEKDYFFDPIEDIEWPEEFYTTDKDGYNYLNYDKIWEYIDKKFEEVFGFSRYEVENISLYQ